MFPNLVTSTWIIAPGRSFVAADRFTGDSVDVPQSVDPAPH